MVYRISYYPYSRHLNLDRHLFRFNSYSSSNECRRPGQLSVLPASTEAGAVASGPRRCPHQPWDKSGSEAPGPLALPAVAGHAAHDTELQRLSGSC